MDLRQLRYFISVAENLNFTEAAKQLYVAQPTVSQQIAELESYLGVKLFVRDKRSVHLTPHGRVLLREAHALISKANEVVEKTRQARIGLMGSLKIGFLSYTIKDYFPKLIPIFRKKYPAIELQLIQFAAASLHKALLRGEIDIGFAFSFDYEDAPEVIWKVLFSDTVTLAMRDDHPLLKKLDLQLADFKDEPFVTFSREVSPNWFDLVMRICVARGFVPRIVNQATTAETPLFLAESGLGIAICSRRVKEFFAFNNLRYFDIQGNDARFDAVVAWKKREPNSSVAVFIEELENECYLRSPQQLARLV